MKCIRKFLNTDLHMGVEDALAISVFTLINQFFKDLNLIYFLIVFLPLWIAFKITFMNHVSRKENKN